MREILLIWWNWRVHWGEFGYWPNSPNGAMWSRQDSHLCFPIF